MIPVCVADFERHAKNVLSKSIFDYYFGGADEERTLERNVKAFDRLLIRPRFCRDVSNCNTEVELFNGCFKLKSPICIAATASQKMAHFDGELATVKAAKISQTLMSVSTIATSSLEEIAKEAGPDETDIWFQLYIYKNRQATETLIRRVESSGYKAIVVTVDTSVSGKRRRDLKNRFALPGHLKMANFAEMQDQMASMGMNEARPGQSGFATYVSAMFEDNITWDTIKWLKSITKLPVMIKGILTAEDAKDASNIVDGIIVSNHGARQLDSAPATIEVLPEIVKAVENKCEVFIDGGFRTGNDIFKALALGAKAVFVGRPILWGLAYNGHQGVLDVLRILNEELKITMALSGCKTLEQIRTMPNLVVHENYYINSKL